MSQEYKPLLSDDKISEIHFSKEVSVLSDYAAASKKVRVIYEEERKGLLQEIATYKETLKIKQRINKELQNDLRIANDVAEERYDRISELEEAVRNYFSDTSQSRAELNRTLKGTHKQGKISNR